LPENLTVLKPCVREDTIDPPHDIGQLSHARLAAAASFITQRQAARKVFLGRECRGCPIERVAGVVDRATWLWWLVNGAQVLPFRRTHLRTCLSRARRVVGKEVDDQLVSFDDEEAT